MRLQFGLAALIFVSSLAGFANAKPVKLLCTSNKFGVSGPLEIDLENHVVYRFVQRERWQITGVQDQFVTFSKLRDTGGEIDVLNTATGDLESAGLFLSCYDGLSHCAAGSAHLLNLPMDALKCSRGLLAD